MTSPDSSQPAEETSIRRVRHEPRRRHLVVADVKRLTPIMVRITATGDDLSDFVSAAPDDHVKLFLPSATGEGSMRDYTPRRFDEKRRELLIDLVDHAGGPAAEWARSVQVGDTVTIGGPRGSAVIEGSIDHWILIGDETALPAIGRRIEELAPAIRVQTIVAVPGPADEQVFTASAEHSAHWIHRPLESADAPEHFLHVLADLELSPKCFVWVAAEANVARSIRDAVLARGLPRHRVKASGYWVKGQADASVKSLED